ncbi:uncharacterized protein B0H64DRAFT_399511, partial [Chaetomium fimeti]
GWGWGWGWCIQPQPAHHPAAAAPFLYLALSLSRCCRRCAALSCRGSCPRAWEVLDSDPTQVCCSGDRVVSDVLAKSRVGGSGGGNNGGGWVLAICAVSTGAGD